MRQTLGIKYMRGITNRRRYVRVDLDMYGGNEALEDFLDIADANMRQTESTRSMDEVIAQENKRRGIENV